MALRSIALTDEQDSLVETLVRSGRYRDADAVVREGLRLVADQEAQDVEKLEALRAAVQVGLGDLENGRYIEFESVGGLVEHLKGRTDQILSGKRRR